MGPDCVTNFGCVDFEQTGKDEVRVSIHGSAGEPRTATLKALVGLREGFMTEEMVIFAGPDALKRAQMTQQLLEYRFNAVNLEAQEIRFDYLGVNAVHREASPPMVHEPYEIILRVAIKTKSRAQAEKLRKEIDPLAVNGVYGTGKWATSASGSRVGRSSLFMKVKMGTPRRRHTSKSLRVWLSMPLPASTTMMAASTAVSTR